MSPRGLLGLLAFAQIQTPLLLADIPVRSQIAFISSEEAEHGDPVDFDQVVWPRRATIYHFQATTRRLSRPGHEGPFDIVVSHETGRMVPIPGIGCPGPLPSTSGDIGLAAFGVPGLIVSLPLILGYRLGRSIADRASGMDAHSRALLADIRNAVPATISRRIETAFRLRAEEDMRRAQPVDLARAEALLAGSRVLRQRFEQGRPHETNFPDRIQAVWIDEDGVEFASFHDLGMETTQHAELEIHGSRFRGENARRISQFGITTFEEKISRDPCPCCEAKVAAAPPA